MSVRPSTSRRLFVGVVALGAALAGGLVAAPSAAAAPQVRYFTAALAPGAVTPGAATPMTLTVKNTSTAISFLDRVRVTIPAGFTVAPGGVTSLRGGWSASLTDATTLTAKTSTPLRSGLYKNESLTINLTATTQTGFCPSAAVPWTVRADGILLPFVLQGATPGVTVTPSATCTNAALSPGTPATLTIPGAVAGLGNGAAGNVALYSLPCVENCFGSDTVVTLTGNFKANGQPLYGFGGGLSPATMTLTCSADDCPYAPVPQIQSLRSRHWHCEQQTCPAYDPTADLANYPVWVALETSTPGVYGDYVQAQPCVNGAPVGGATFCVDTAHMTRPLVADDYPLCSFGGLTIPVLFANDPKFIVGH